MLKPTAYPYHQTSHSDYKGDKGPDRVSLKLGSERGDSQQGAKAIKWHSPSFWSWEEKYRSHLYMESDADEKWRIIKEYISVQHETLNSPVLRHSLGTKIQAPSRQAFAFDLLCQLSLTGSEGLQHVLSWRKAVLAWLHGRLNLG